ncbi:hypothetical protein DSM03_101518 [Leeuwenhoekiella aestuarii]|uniref:Lipocalin-like protein n=1 Tax=Leeuwenhoekiella aestuarii TaxID=2249426 RepID=A0A4Q0P0R2_9FLAO|nr:hypothetical protein [Leeuwenhoekiella aestuarii]RXG17819.1 hypothetical protein DSM04_1013 [Leeuwenhoekiella aestuarii]RXG19148.1 hypothetical protein DSM03_101518 [Leeuwenhoekiella aestuarii]
MKNLIYVFILALGMISCSSDDQTRIDNSDLIGDWNWTNTDGGIGFHIHETPETTGKIIHLNLKGNYEFSVTENGTEISNGTYELIMKESIYSGKMERLIQFPENEQYLGFVKTGIINSYKNEKLNISDNNADGIGSEFVRIE